LDQWKLENLKKSRFGEQQIAFILRQAEEDTTVDEVGLKTRAAGAACGGVLVKDGGSVVEPCGGLGIPYPIRP
jgi:hypothetical protein